MFLFFVDNFGAYVLLHNDAINFVFRCFDNKTLFQQHIPKYYKVDLTKVYKKTSNRYTKDVIGEYLEKTDEGKRVLNGLEFLKITNNERKLDLKVRRKIIKQMPNTIPIA